MLLNLEFSEKNTKNKICRICLSEETNPIKNPLICPCICKGSMKYIHYYCLKNWLNLKVESELGHINIETERPTITYSTNDICCELCKTKLPDYVKHDGKLYNVSFYKPKYEQFIVLESIRNDNRRTKFIHIIPLSEYQMHRIGRLNNCDLSLPDPSISRVHCCFYIENNQLVLENNSKYGTKVLIQQQKLNLVEDYPLCIETQNTYLKMYVEKPFRFFGCCDASTKSNIAMQPYQNQNQKGFDLFCSMVFKDDDENLDDEDEKEEDKIAGNINMINNIENNKEKENKDNNDKKSKKEKNNKKKEKRKEEIKKNNEEEGKKDSKKDKKEKNLINININEMNKLDKDNNIKNNKKDIKIIDSNIKNKINNDNEAKNKENLINEDAQKNEKENGRINNLLKIDDIIKNIKQDNDGKELQQSSRNNQNKKINNNIMKNNEINKDVKYPIIKTNLISNIDKERENGKINHKKTTENGEYLQQIQSEENPEKDKKSIINILYNKDIKTLKADADNTEEKMIDSDSNQSINDNNKLNKYINLDQINKLSYKKEYNKDNFNNSVVNNYESIFGLIPNEKTETSLLLAPRHNKNIKFNNYDVHNDNERITYQKNSNKIWNKFNWNFK